MKQMGLTISLIVTFFLSMPVNTTGFRTLKNDPAHLAMAKNPAFDAVGKIELVFFNKKTSQVAHSFCTGTLFDSRTVLAGASCVEPIIKDNNYVFMPGGSKFFLGNDVWNEPKEERAITSAIYISEFESNPKARQARDIALLYLDAPIRSIEPAKLYTGNPSHLVGKPVVLVGFGYIGDPTHVKEQIDYQKRASLQQIQSYDRSMLKTEFRKMGWMKEAMFTHGDQGGPMFFKEKGQWFLVGVNAFREAPKIEGVSPNPDPRVVVFGTIGYSMAISIYADWIKENAGEKILRRKTGSGQSEWSFGPYWQDYVVPNNQIGSYYHAHVDQPGALLINNLFSLDKLVVEHPQAKVYLVRSWPTDLNEDDVEKEIMRLSEEKNDFEAVELRRTMIKNNRKDGHLSRIAQLKAHEVVIEKGSLHIDGELWVDSLELKGGTLMGSGEVIHADISVLNSGGTVAPGGPGTEIGVLTLWGGYEQNDSSKIPAKLVIRVKGNELLKPGRSAFLKSDLLKVKGRAKLGGTLEIREIGHPIRVNDRIEILHSMEVQGQFNRIIAPPNLWAVPRYYDDRVTIEFRAINHLSAPSMDNMPLNLSAGQSLSLTQAGTFASFRLNGGYFKGQQSIAVLDEQFSNIEGIFELNGREPGEIKIYADYEQSHATLSLRFLKISEDKLHPENDVWQTDSLAIFGNAHLGGHISINLLERALMEPKRRFEIIRAEKIEGEFTSLEKFSSILQPRLIYEPKKVFVEFFLDGSLSDIVYKDPEAKIVAEFLDQVQAHADEPQNQKYRELLRALYRMPKDQIEENLAALKILPIFNPLFEEPSFELFGDAPWLSGVLPYIK